jgi:hypothetical protein
MKRLSAELALQMRCVHLENSTHRDLSEQCAAAN